MAQQETDANPEGGVQAERPALRLFVDSSAWVALYYRQDRAHSAAARFWRDLRRRPARLTTSDYVFDETVTLVRARGGHNVARSLGDLLLKTKVVDLAEVSSQVRDQAWELFVRHDDKDFSFTDCTSFVIMQTLSLTDAFAFDEHFAQMGFRLWPQA